MPKKYVEGIFEIANIDPKKIGNLLTNEEVKDIFEITKKTVSDIVLENHDPLYRNGKTEVLPIQLGKIEGEITKVTAIEGLDTVFTQNIVDKGN